MAEDKNKEELEGERGVPSVVRQKKKPNGLFILIGFIAVSALLITLALMMQGEKETTETVLTEPEEEQFKAAKTQKITLPEVDKDLKLEIPEVTPAEKPDVVLETIEVKPELTPEEKRRLQMEQQLKERRKRSKMVVFNRPSQGGKKPEKDALEARKEALLDRLENNPAISGSGGIPASLLGGSGGSDSESLGSLLKGTPTEPVVASIMRDRPYVIGEGKVISAILETAVQSDLPGKIRAVVTHDVFSEDGKYLLVERGSRLVGEYRGGLKQGQARIFALWTRMITPQGIDVQLNSGGIGPLGRTGMDGYIDHHFMERFGASMLLSIIGAYGAGNSNDARDIELGENFNKSAEIALENSINIKPTIHINQGKKIKVFVNQDLNFRGVYELRVRQKKFR